MKKIIITSFCLLSLTAFSQKKKPFNNPRPQAVERPNASYLQYTTTDEYNYMVKGYKIEKEGGLDAKKGYYFENPLELADDLYSFKYYFMHRTADNSLAGVMVIAYSKAWDNTYYLAIPINNADLVKYYYQDLEKWDKPMIQSYAKFSSALMAQFSAMLMQK